MNAFAGIRAKGVETRPPSFFPWRLQWGSNPHNPLPPSPIFTLAYMSDIFSLHG